MATQTTADFNDLLKRYQPYTLLIDTLKKKNYFWNTVRKSQGWKGGILEVPFEGGEYSSLEMGQLTASSDVASAKYLMGTVSVPKELHGTMKFYEKDLDRHGDLEKSYLEIVPAKVDQFIARMGERISIMLLADGAVAAATLDGTAGGVLAVDRPEHFTLGEKVEIKDADTAAVQGYVTAIDMAAKTIKVETARSAGAAVNLSAFTVAAKAKVYIPGASGNEGFTSLGSQLLSAANGGSTNIHGLAKSASPILQAQQHSGASMTASNILDKLIDFHYDTVQLGKGEPNEILVSFAHFKAIAKKLEQGKASASLTEKSAGYGFRSVAIVGPQGELKITALRDMPTDRMYMLDWAGIDFHGDKFFERKRHLDGNEYFLERATSGYAYLVDTKFYGDLVVRAPAKQGIVHSIDPAQFA